MLDAISVNSGKAPYWPQLCGTMYVCIQMRDSVSWNETLVEIRTGFERFGLLCRTLFLLPASECG